MLETLQDFLNYLRQAGLGPFVLYLGVLMFLLGAPNAFASGYFWSRLGTQQIDTKIIGKREYLDLWFGRRYEIALVVLFFPLIVVGAILKGCLPQEPEAERPVQESGQWFNKIWLKVKVGREFLWESFKLSWCYIAKIVVLVFFIWGIIEWIVLPLYKNNLDLSKTAICSVIYLFIVGALLVGVAFWGGKVAKGRKIYLKEIIISANSEISLFQETNATREETDLGETRYIWTNPVWNLEKLEEYYLLWRKSSNGAPEFLIISKDEVKAFVLSLDES